MTLPRDGFPRITSEGIRLLQQGLTGDFEGWAHKTSNHPMEIPETEVSNCAIRADPTTMHFYATTWFGHGCPKLHGIIMAPQTRFDAVELYGDYTPPTATIKLHTSDKPWGWLTGVNIAIDDRAFGLKDTTLYERIPGTEGIGEDEDEHEVFEVQPCQRTLEGFRWLTATSSAPMTI